MTPNELLSEVVGSFAVLLLDDPEAHQRILRQALGVFQDKAGVLRCVELVDHADGDGSYIRPADVLTIVGCGDKAGCYTPVQEVPGGKLLIHGPDGLGPYSLSYMANLRSMDLYAESLPDDSISILYEYVRLLIEIPNTEQLRLAANQAGMDASQYPDAATLESNKVAKEADMKAGMAFLPVYSIH